MISDAVNDFLMGSNAPAAKFLNVGDEVKGTVISAEETQQTDLDGNPKTWDDGNARMQVVITLQTELNDPAIDDDDGRRRVYVNKVRMRSAISEAIRAAGAPKLEIGGKLAVKYTGNGEPTKRGFQPPKIFAAFYKAAEPEVSAIADAFGADEYDDEPF